MASLHPPKLFQRRSVLPISVRDCGSSPSLSNDEKGTGTHSRRRSHQQAYRPDPNRVFQATKDHRSWESRTNPCVFENLPKFDDLKPYGLSEDEEDNLVRKEIDKYCRYAESERPDPFDSNGIFDKTNAHGFADLTSVIDQIQCSLHIILHDNASVALEHCPNAEFYEKFFRPSRRAVLERYGKEPRFITGRRPKLLKDTDKNTRVYHAMVDFIFGSTVWWLMRVAQNKNWEAQIIAILARWAVKLKIIALDPVHCADRCLERGVEIIRQLWNANKDDDESIIIHLLERSSNEAKKIEFSSDDLNLAFGYYASKLQLRKILEMIIVGVTDNMIVQQAGSRSSSRFEVRTLIYKGGVGGTLRELFVTRHVNVLVSSNSSSIVHSYIALQLAIANAERIRETLGKRPKSGVTESDAVIMSWSQAGIPSKVQTDRLDDLISVLVPLGLRTERHWLLHLSTLLRSDVRDEEELIEKFEFHPDDDITTEFRLNTQASLKRKRQVELPFVESDIISTSRIPLWRSPEEQNTHYIPMEAEDPRASNTGVKNQASSVASDLERCIPEINRWVISEDSIMVHCRMYSISALIIAFLVIFGSLLVPFLVQERMKGVDPFQWVTFAWLLAGAFLVGAKSRYHESWPWHDFVRGQILCQGVKQLANVSGINPQTILLYLLHNEMKNPIAFRGPYKTIFSKCSSSSGLSIDEPINHSTLVAAGFMVLKVANEETEYLLFRDIRDDRFADPEEHLICDIAQKPHKIRSSRMWHQDVNILKLMRKKVAGTEDILVLGQYARESSFG
ncbi:hypothetical protein NA57DRAFT_56618 [Rhizodiscina lignyota]|uniref:Uncharacterized protein n=1 Tax=Rhizodiscina lignyota TaxID=1504668 RepID=A0A9P4IIC4_9PEZI|nr:hypothetical protein NA57DRAFT_56618 [Rhizodiscina lignyota]